MRRARAALAELEKGAVELSEHSTLVAQVAGTYDAPVGLASQIFWDPCCENTVSARASDSLVKVEAHAQMPRANVSVLHTKRLFF